MRARGRQKPSYGPTPWVVLGLSLVLALGAFAGLRRQSAERTQARLHDTVAPTLSRFGGRMDAYVALLRGVSGLFRTEATTTRKDFAHYVDALVVREHYAGLHGVGFASDLNDVRTVDRLTAEARADGLTDFTYRPEGTREPAGVIVYLQPDDEVNARSLGYDLAARPALASAITLARDTGQPELATTISTINAEPWLLLFLPMYQEGNERLPSTATQDERRARFFGCAYASFLARELFKDIFREPPSNVAIRLFDGRSTNPNDVVFDSMPGSDVWSTSPYRTTTAMLYAGHTWTVELAALPAFVSLPERTLAPLAGLGGLFISLVLFALARVDARARRRTDMQLRRTTLLANVNDALTQVTGVGLLPILQQCVEALVSSKELAVARIFTLERESRVLEAQASAGFSAVTEGLERRVPVSDDTMIARAASTRLGVVRRLSESTAPERANVFSKHDGLTDFAAFPLLLGEQCIGVLWVGDREELPSETLDTIAAVADAVALGIQNSVAEEALRVSQQRYQLATRATQDAIWDHDLRRGERLWTAGGSNELAPSGSSWADSVHPDDRARVEASLRAAIESNQDGWQAEYRFRRSTGSWALVVDRAVIERDAAGTAVRMVGAMQDASARKLAEAERERLIRSLERSNAELDHFAYVTSHDLKAPLRGIASISQWIEDDLGDQVPAETKQHLELMRGRVQRLEALINGVLAYSRAGRFEGKAERVSVKELVDEVSELLAPNPQARVETAGELPTLMTDKVPLQQVFMNLIGNALKYAGRPDAHAVVSGVREGDDWRFSVKDNGPGIAAQHQERIWAMFATLQSRDKVESTGIGLAVVKKIVEARGGRVSVVSAPGEGSTFSFTWKTG